MNILLYPCSVQGSLNSEGGKEWDLPVASASKVSEGRHDFHYQGLVLIALLMYALLDCSGSCTFSMAILDSCN